MMTFLRALVATIAAVALVAMAIGAYIGFAYLLSAGFE